MKHAALFITVIALFSAAPVIADPLPLCGVNLAGADFGEHELPGIEGKDYTYPTDSEIDYFCQRGMSVFRLPFRWERLQHAQNGPLDADELKSIQAFVAHATGKGAQVILDPHNYARYYPSTRPSDGLIGGAVPAASFAEFWTRLATQFQQNPRVIFGLVNEPHDIDTDQWLRVANSTIAAIRKTGASNLILVPGNRWTGGWTWNNTDRFGRSNAVAMLEITDPGNNFAFDIHQYFDGNGSGTSPAIGSDDKPNNPHVGVQRLEPLTRWLEANHRRAFLGEFAVANAAIGDDPSQIGDETIGQLLDHVEAHRDVWLGWTWWAAGPRWGDYLFTLEPNAAGDRPAMKLLMHHLPHKP